MVHRCSAAQWLKNTCVETYDRVNYYSTSCWYNWANWFFLLPPEFSVERCEKNVLHGEMKKGKVFGKGDVGFLLGVNENLASEKNLHSFFFLFSSCHLKMSPRRLAVSLVSLFSSSSSSTRRCFLLVLFPCRLCGFAAQSTQIEANSSLEDGTGALSEARRWPSERVRSRSIKVPA